jgi:hypothetical protein
LSSTTDLKIFCDFQKTQDVGQMEAIEKLLLEVNDDGQIEGHILNVLSALAVAGSNMTQKVLSNFISEQGDLQHAGSWACTLGCVLESRSRQPDVFQTQVSCCSIQFFRLHHSL